MTGNNGQLETAGLTSRVSLSSRGAMLHFAVAIFLISVIPTATLAYLALAGQYGWHAEPPIPMFLLVLVTASVCLGYVLMSRYPRTVIRLRQYLDNLAKGELPEKMKLITAEDDLAAIAKCMDVIMFETRARISLIENQHKALVEAERLRVMIQSLGTACHHIGQPATVISAYLGLMSRQETPPETRGMLQECLRAVHSLNGVLEQLQKISVYQTEPYLQPGVSGSDFGDHALIVVEPARA